MSLPLHIRLDQASKRFVGEWVFRGVNLEIAAGEKLVVLGANGSGKSTLMQVLCSYQSLTKGKVSYEEGEKVIEPAKIFVKLSIATPYLELIEDYSIAEAIDHQRIFKRFQNSLDTTEIIRISGLAATGSKPIRLYSSGMKQRLKLSLAILADCPLLFLDEPCSNLDAAAIDWYKNLVENYAMHKTIIVCSNNVRDEFGFCTSELRMESLKG